MMAIHVIAFNCLLHNPDALADQSVRNNATDVLRANPTKQNVNQYFIDAILRKRRSVKRSSEDVWNRSLYNATTDTPRSDTQQPRCRRLDTADDNPTPGTSGTSTPRRRLTNVPRFAKPTSPPKNTPRGRAATQHGRRQPALTTDMEGNDDLPTQLYVPPPTNRQSRKDRKRTAACNLPTSFDEDDQAHDSATKKNKRPLVGPPTAKNRRTTPDSDRTSSETEDEQEQPLAKTKSHTKRPTRTVTKKAATVLSSESDVDDDELGITPRTPPQSPFYRGHREPTGERRKTSPPVATTSKGQSPHAKKKTKQRAEKTPAIDSAKEQQNKPKKKKHTTPLEHLVNEQDKLYKDLEKIAKKGK